MSCTAFFSAYRKFYFCSLYNHIYYILFYLQLALIKARVISTLNETQCLIPLHINFASRNLWTLNNQGGAFVFNSVTVHAVVNGELGWMSTAHAPYFHSRWAFSFHWAVNSSPMAAQVERASANGEETICCWITPVFACEWQVLIRAPAGWSKLKGGQAELKTS